MEDEETTCLYWQLSGTIALTRILDNKDFFHFYYILLSNILSWIPIKKKSLDSETKKKKKTHIEYKWFILKMKEMLFWVVILYHGNCGSHPAFHVWSQVKVGCKMKEHKTRRQE